LIFYLSSSALVYSIIITIVILQKIRYEQTKNKMHGKIVQCVKAIDCKVLKLIISLISDS